MSTASTPSHGDHYVDFDEYVEFQLEKTRKSIRSNDLLTALAAALVLVLTGLLTFVVLDHWLIPGGFSVAARWCWFLGFTSVVTGWLVWKIGVPALWTVNRLFAARELEQADPALRSNLLNWVDLRDAGCKVHPAVMQTIEKQAATELSKMDVGQAVDHRPLLQASYALLAVVVLFCGYALFSPKRISSALWRILPFTQAGVVTRTEILDVTPGDTTLLSRGRLEVGVTLRGEIPADVLMLYTTADGRIQDEAVVLRPEAEGLTRFHGIFAGETGNGVVQDFSYRIVAGDAQSRRYRVSVHQPPSATVQQIALRFPEYMKLEESATLGGHIDGWEGAIAAISATSDKPCRSATLQFMNDPQASPTGEEVVVQVTDGTQLQAEWTLGFRPDGTYPKHYRIQCRNDAGEVDPSPAVYNIAVKPDRPPEVVLLHPERDLTAPANAVIPLLVQASDPDFELGYVNLQAEKAGQSIHRRQLSEGRQPKVTIKDEFDLSSLNLQTGDEIEFWIEAFDNKQPRRNRKNTPKLKIRIADPVSKEEAAQQLAEEKQKRDEQLAEAQQEQRGEREAAPPEKTDDMEEGSESEPKDREKSPPDKNPPQKGNSTASEQAGGGSSGEKSDGSQGKSQANSEGQGNSKNGGDSGEQKSPENPLSPEGADDDQVLQKLNERLNKQGQQPDSSNKPNDKGQSSPKSKPSGEQNPQQSNSDDMPTDDADKENGDSKPQSKPKPGGKNSKSPNDPAQQEDSTETGDQKSTPNQPDGGDNNGEPGSQSKPKPSARDPKLKSPKAGGQTGDQEPMTGEKADDDSGTGSDPQPKSKPDSKPGTRPKTAESKDNGPGDKPQPQKADDDAEQPKGSQPKESDDPKSGAKPEPMPGEGEKSESTGKKPDKQNQPEKSGDKKSDAQGGGGEEGPSEPDESASPSEPGNDSNGGDSKPAEKNANNNANNTAKPNGGKSSKSNSKPAGGDEASESSDSASDSPKDDSTESNENSADSKEKSAAKSKSKDGEKTSSKDKPKSRTGEKTDPKTGKKSATESDDSATDRAPDGSETKRPGAGTDAEKEKSDLSEKPNSKSRPSQKDPLATKDELENGVEPPTGIKSKSKVEQKTGGSKDAAEEELKGPGNPEGQKSDQPAGGEPGGSKEDKEGNSGSRTKGPGEKSKQAGEENIANEKTGVSDPKQRPGKGSESKPGGEKSSQKSGQKSSQKSASKSGKGSEASESGEGEASAEGDSDKPSSKTTGGKSKSGGKPGQQNANSSSNPTQGDAKGNGFAGSGGEGSESQSDPEAANLEYNRQAAELVLQRLKDELNNDKVDPKLLEELGWTPEQLARFTERLARQLEIPANELTPQDEARREQFEEMLKSLDLKNSGAKKTGKDGPQREVDQSGARRAPVPADYKAAYEAFTKNLAKQKPKAAPKQK